MQLTNLLSSGLKYVKKVTSFCQVLKKMKEKENWFFFSASRCIFQRSITAPVAARVRVSRGDKALGREQVCFSCKCFRMQSVYNPTVADKTSSDVGRRAVSLQWL